MELKQDERDARDSVVSPHVTLLLDIFISIIVAILAAPLGGAAGLGVGIAVTKLGEVDGPPGAVGVFLAVCVFGLLFGICAFVICLKRFRKRAKASFSLNEEPESSGV